MINRPHVTPNKLNMPSTFLSIHFFNLPATCTIVHAESCPINILINETHTLVYHLSPPKKRTNTRTKIKTSTPVLFLQITLGFLSVDKRVGRIELPTRVCPAKYRALVTIFCVDPVNKEQDIGADRGNRNPICCLEGSHSTTKLCPQNKKF